MAKVHKHDWKFAGVNRPIPGLNVKGPTGKQYHCSCGAIQMRGSE